MNPPVAGRELDAEIDRHVFGVEPCFCGPIGGYDPETGTCSRCGGRPSRHFSTDIAAAWEVWNKLPSPKRLSELDPKESVDPDCWPFRIMCGGTEFDHDSDFSYNWFAEGATAAEVICLVALDALPQAEACHR